MESIAQKLVLGFNFQRSLCKMEFEEVCKLIWTDCDSFAITYLM